MMDACSAECLPARGHPVVKPAPIE